MKYENSSEYLIALEYYLYLEFTKKEFNKNINIYGVDYFKYYYKESFEDKIYQCYIGNITYN